MQKKQSAPHQYAYPKITYQFKMNFLGQCPLLKAPHKSYGFELNSHDGICADSQTQSWLPSPVLHFLICRSGKNSRMSFYLLE